MAMPISLAFVSFVLILVLTPGATMALVTKSALEGGRRAALLTVLGIHIAVIVHIVLAATGLSLLIGQSPLALNTMKLFGGAYLAFVGSTGFFKQVSPGSPSSLSPSNPKLTLGQSPFIRGFITDILNPKVVLFYLAVIPGFIQTQTAESHYSIALQTVVLASVHFTLSLIWLTCFGLMTAHFGKSSPSCTPWVRKSFLIRATDLMIAGLGLIMIASAIGFLSGVMKG